MMKRFLPQQIKKFSSTAAALQTDFQGSFGANFSQSQSNLDQYSRTETYHVGYKPFGVVFPKNTEEVAQAVDICIRNKAAIIGYGAGTSLEGQLVAQNDSSICLDFRDMNKILEINPGNMDCLVQPGVTREQLNQELRYEGLTFTVDPGANASIGGMVATNASGTTTVRYGSMRQNVLELEFVSGEGKIIKTGTRARKTSAGYDLRALLIGSEGTLGLITAIRLKLFPIPECVASARCQFETFSDAVELVTSASMCGVPLARMELVDSLTIDCLNKYMNANLPVKHTVFLDFHGSETGVQEQIEVVQGLAEDCNGSQFEMATVQEDINKLWKTRHNAFWASKSQAPPGTESLVTDVAVPVDCLSECISQAKSEIDEMGFFAPMVGHVGDGNFHFCVFHDQNCQEQIERVHDFSSRLTELALGFNGTCTGEHGVGLGKMKSLQKQVGPDAIHLMQAIKSAMDPHNIFNPGKVIPTL